MCLTTYQFEPSIANEDIVCYKRLTRDGDKFITPYRHTKVEIGKTYGSKLKFDELSRTVDKGLHSYAVINSIDKDIYLCDIVNKKYAVAECIIPKGSKYFAGKFGFEPSFASDKIIYDRIIPNKEYAKCIINSKGVIELSNGDIVKSYEELINKLCV
jgi:hypothetical protein